jgi:DNA end-binding protein Ku
VFDQSLPKPEPRMLQIAEKIIEQQEAKFDPRQFKDRYEDALRALIARKKKGKPVVAEAPPEKEDKVVDLMDALRKSLEGGGGPSRDKTQRFLEARDRRRSEPKDRKKGRSKGTPKARRRKAA